MLIYNKMVINAFFLLKKCLNKWYNYCNRSVDFVVCHEHSQYVLLKNV